MKAQLARAQEQLKVKQAELAESRSDLIVATSRAESESVRVRELEAELRTVKLEVEVDKLREVDSVRRKFAAERKLLREDRERDTAHFESWKADMTAEKREAG